MQAVRAPAVAGSFYPADPSQLRETVARLLAGAAYGAPPKALIAPHAGYAYSGPIAASAFRRVEDAPLSRVVLLGPSHFAPLRGLALPGAAAMRTPLGDIPVEEIPLPQDPRAHAEEHSLEVEVPFRRPRAAVGRRLDADRRQLRSVPLSSLSRRAARGRGERQGDPRARTPHPGRRLRRGSGERIVARRQAAGAPRRVDRSAQLGRHGGRQEARGRLRGLRVLREVK